jgi:hypothetical protein
MRQHGQEKPMLYRRGRPGLSPFTVLLTILWLLLVVYIITHPDPIGVIILVVMGVFVAGPALFLAVALWRARQRQPDGAALDGVPNEQSEYDALNGNVYDEQNGRNGHHAAGANGAQERTPGEIPDEGGSNL